MLKIKTLTRLLILSTLTLSGCVNAQLKADYDARNFSERDKKELAEISATQTNELASAQSIGGLYSTYNNTQKTESNLNKYFCNCYKKLGNKCLKNSEGVSEEDRSLWLKSVSAQFTLVSMGFKAPDKDLCD
jgi:hypothetical protein